METSLRMASRSALALAALSALVLVPGRAAAEGCQEVADPTSAYSVLLQQGVELFKNDALDEALARLAEAEQICAVNPQLSYVRGRVLAKKGDCVAALAEFQRAKVHLEAGVVKVDPSFLEKVDARIAECAVGQLTVTCAEAGVSLVIGSQEAECPADLQVPVGKVTVEARQQGREAWSRTLEVAPGAQALSVPLLEAVTGMLSFSCPPEVTSVEVRASEEAIPVSVACPGHTELAPGMWIVGVPGTDYLRRVEVRAHQEASHTVVLTPMAGAPIAAPPIESGGGYTGAGLAVGAVGLAVAGGGVAMFLLARGNVEDIKGGCCTYQEAQDKQSEAELFDLLGLSGMGLGGALLVTGIILVALPGDSVDAESAASMSFGADSDRVWVFLTHRF